MKKHKITFLLLLIISFNSYAQDYKQIYGICNNADSILYIEKDTISYIEELKKIQGKNRFFQHEYNLSKKYLEINDTTNSLKHLLLAFKKGASLDIIPEALSINHKNYLIKNYKEQHLQYLKNENVSPDFLYGIHELLGSDQVIRVQFMDSIISEKEWIKTDSLNLITLLTLIDKHGFPTQKDYGSQFHVFYILMIHLPYLDEDIYQKFLNFYKGNLLNGSIQPNLLAYFIDRHNYTEAKEQTYGSMADPYFGVAKINDEKNIEKRRKELYLPSMNVWLAKRGIK